MRSTVSWALYAVFIAGSAMGQVCTASGSVVNSLTGQPVAHAQVSVQSRGAATDADGHWSIAGLACGTVRFTVERAGYLQTVSPPVAAAPDIGLRLTPESSVAGKVLDEAGDPVVGAEIQVYDSAVQQGRRVMRQAFSANTNGAGDYRIGPLSAGTYRLCAHSSKAIWPVGGGEPLIYTESCYPAQPLPIASGVELRQNFTLTAVKGVHVRGNVSGLPAGARAVIRMGRGSTRLPAGGRFDVAGITPGTYALEGLADVDGRSVLATTRIEVGASDIDNAILTFVPSVTVTGTVRSSAEDILIIVNLVPSDPAWDAGKPEWDAGLRTFTFPSVAPGRYRVAVAPLRPPYYVKSIEMQGEDISDRELTISSPLAIDIMVGEGLGSAEGIVVDGDGKPAPGDVMLLRGSQPPYRGTAQPDGRFTIGNIAPGEYSAYAFDDARDAEYADPDWMGRNAGDPVAVTVAAGGHAQVGNLRHAGH
jgi:hypothetical protein